MNIEILNLESAPRDFEGMYGGKSGFKYGIIFNNERWMIKFPENTKNFPGRNKKNNHLPSYTTSPVSEYIGSHIYESLGINTHQTRLAYRNKKIVVACKDFNMNQEFVDFERIKNFEQDLEEALLGSSSSYQGEYLHDVLYLLDNSELLKNVKGMKEHFWDMFLVDAFIRNNDRNNGNWGIMVNHKNKISSIAPVFDNGNAFFNKRNPSVSEARIQSEQMLIEDALKTSVSFFKDEKGNAIHPFAYIESLHNQDCTSALLRFAKRLDMKKIKEIICSIPETAFGLSVITFEQKEHYYKMMELMITKSLNPTLQKLNQKPIDLPD